MSNLEVNGTPVQSEVRIENQPDAKVVKVQKINSSTVEVVFANNEILTIDFYGENIFRLFKDSSGGLIRDPEAQPEAKILVENPRRPVDKVNVTDINDKITITSKVVSVLIDKNTELFKVINLKTNTVVMEATSPVTFDKKGVVLSLKEYPQEYFYGGGVQNGRFSHKGKTVAIENQNSWTDGGVASPCPFYWSTNGYGIMWHTFNMGTYDFGAKEKGIVKLKHETNYLDVFVMVDDSAVALLNDFYQLTGNPVLLPKFGFYQGHLNAYNRDFWKENPDGILFEDGKKYKESQTDNGGIRESLNGEKNNYQFSARAVIDRYKAHDMPLGWILPNDGYGAGYGQTDNLDGNIQNLKSFGDYARKNGVEIGLWTQSDLHPKAEVAPLLQRDIVKEVKAAGVRVLKTDVAWVGAGYSFGLNGVTDVAHLTPYYGNDSRPFIISLDGWAGTQRFATIWSGDQTGGVWEYIRFHIPTYIGSGLSGQPNITSDMDGIFGGKNVAVNVRDFQWKTFTPMQLNMDGWGANEKYPQAFGETATSINRNYLKLKSALLPYSYSIAKQAVNGLPIMRAMFLEYPNAYTQGAATKYQYLYGPYFLIAPIYQATQSDDKGNDIRNGIYLPEGVWIDYFSGEKYDGNRIINCFDAPIWKLPVFVKNGAIIPMSNASNNVSEINNKTRIYEIYASGKNSFTEYDDDGVTEAYKLGAGSSTLIETQTDSKGNALVSIQPMKGNFEGFVKSKTTELRINVTEKPKAVSAKVGKQQLKLSEAKSLSDFNHSENVYYYNASPNFNQFATKGSEFEKTTITKNPQFLVKLASSDITANATTVEIKGFKFEPTDKQRVKTGTLSVALNARVSDKNATAYTLKPTWTKAANADYYEILFNDINYSTIKDTVLVFEDLSPETTYAFKIRSVNKDGYSSWEQFSASTKSNPYQFAIPNISAELTAKDQEGGAISNLFDFDESSMWHTTWDGNSVPFDMMLDLKTVNHLDRFDYLPRNGGTNGILLKGSIYYSNNKETWTAAGTFDWKSSNDLKTFAFNGQPSARYIKIAVTSAVGNFGSGRELYVFKVPGTESYLPGDINNDRLIDGNDLTSYINYTGLKKGDADFEGYISNGDINKNDIIDAYDISVVATQLDGDVDATNTEKVAGRLELRVPKQDYGKDEIIEVTVKGMNLISINALSFAIPYNAQDYEFVGLNQLNTKEMENFTKDRLHTDGKKVLYPTFINVGKKEALKGSQDLFVLRFKAKKKIKFDLKATGGLLIDAKMNSVKF
ncbi:alpha-xylosidase [Solitalea longa]|uniref:Alpha-xylosidase n=1 Tax=Solitalea longa TaxID=2079460 RepID=A0A2S4ZXQ0_9SPHI|nr:TIM-barrel domain-containing protein [Solitalea longa]POY35130.1 alpha-xylosidase [Solitalea longa]